MEDIACGHDMKGCQVVRHIHESGGSDPVKIKIEKNSKGTNWEVSVAGDNIDEILSKIDYANKKLEATYGAV